MGAFTETTPATGTMIPIQDARRHCHIDTTDFDVELQSMLWAVHETLQRDLRRSILPRVMTGYFDGFPDEDIELLWGPISAVNSVEYYDEDGNLQTLATSEYWFAAKDERGRICPVTSWPDTQDGRPHSVIVEFACGSATVPESLKHAARILISHWNENREAVSNLTFRTVPMTYKNLVAGLGDVAV